MFENIATIAKAAVTVFGPVLIVGIPWIIIKRLSK